MRTLTALALALVAATAASASAAPARRPAGVTFTDPGGDANALDGANNTGSQAQFDVVKVKLTPFDRTKKTSGVTVAIELAGTPSMTPGTSYTFTASQFGCTVTVSRTITAEGISGNSIETCGTGGGVSHGMTSSLVNIGKTIVFTVPADEFFDATIGAGLRDIEVATTVGDPAVGAPSPRRVDRALYTKTYRLGS